MNSSLWLSRFTTHPKFTLIIGFLMTLIVGSGIFKLIINTDGALLYPENSEAVFLTQVDRQTFDLSPELILLISAESNMKLIRSTEGLEFLKTIHDELNRMPEVDVRKIRSLVNQIYVPDPSKVEFKFFLDEVPFDKKGFEQLNQRVAAFPAINGLYLSSDGREAAIYFSVVHPDNRLEFISGLDQWMKNRSNSGFKIRLLGVGAAESTLGTMVLRDLSVLIPITVALIILLLLFFLRTGAGVTIVMFEVGMVLLWVFGLMGHFSVPVTIVTTILPVILVAVAITDEVHLMERIESALKMNDPAQSFRKGLQTNIHDSISGIRAPLILTSVTTSIGFLTFLTSDIAPLQHFGILTAIGILLAMVWTFTMIPALLMLLPRRFYRTKKFSFQRDSILNTSMNLSGRSKAGSFLIVLLLLLLSPALFNVKVQDSWIENFNKNAPIVKAEAIFNDQFWGSYTCDIVLKAGRNYFYSQEGMRELSKLNGLLLNGPDVGGGITFLTALDRLSSIMGKGESIAYLDEESFKQVFQMIKFVNPVVGLKQWITSKGDRVRIRLLVKNPDYKKSKNLLAFIDQQLNGFTKEHTGITCHKSGSIPMAVDMVQTIVENQLKSIGLTLICILIILISVLGLRYALISFVPIIISGILIFEIIGVAGLNLGITTSMFATITICVGVDFALFVVLGYRKERKRGKDPAVAINTTIRENGRAIGMNAIILAAGFLVLGFSSIKANFQLGLLLALALTIGYFVTIVFIPFILKLTSRS